MWRKLKSFFSASKTLNTMLGDVIFQTPASEGAGSNSSLEWRVKTSADEKYVYVGMEMMPDYWIRAGGSSKNYINFDLETAIRVRENLDRCIEFARKRSGSRA
ncbi:hypothetical protein LG047_02735 [Methylocystis sp. WRRC1]|uniref:hypothetical protein n=1 Tax=unclassified Methylocystis TaxID=2625913 RepID=UPI0001F873B3|nr:MULTISPECIES: hypothetical protein [unclassified Methylocystis]MCC3244248.1 hypothetical protein [Methylocystis sp. WRRC1]